MDLDKIVKKIRNSELNDDDVLKYGRILITEFAKDYHKKQLMLGGVSQQREQLYAVCDELEKSTKQLIPPSMKSWVVNKVLADNCG